MRANVVRSRGPIMVGSTRDPSVVKAAAGSGIGRKSLGASQEHWDY